MDEEEYGLYDEEDNDEDPNGEVLVLAKEKLY